MKAGVVGFQKCAVQHAIIDAKARVYVIDAYSVARETGMGNRINTIMQVCFFAISGVLPRDEAIAHIKSAIQKTYSKRGDAVVQANFAAVDATLAHLHQLEVPAAVQRRSGGPGRPVARSRGSPPCAWWCRHRGTR